MKRRKCSAVVVGVLFSGALGASARGEPIWDWEWITPCVGGVTCEDPCEQFQLPPCPRCFCVGDWDSASRWDVVEHCIGSACSIPTYDYPQTANDLPIVEKSNTGTCEGGTNDGEPCSEGGDCPGGSCEDVEEWLRINLTDETVGRLIIATEATTATTDQLVVEVHSTSLEGNTLTVSFLVIDATNGPVEVQVGDEATLQTGN